MGRKIEVVFDISSLGRLKPNGVPGYHTWEVNGTESDAFSDMVSNLTEMSFARNADIARIYTFVYGKSGASYVTITATVEYYNYVNSDDISVPSVNHTDNDPENIHVDFSTHRERYIQETSQKIIASIMSRADQGVKHEGLDRLSKIACSIAIKMAVNLFDDSSVTQPELVSQTQE